MDLAAAMIEQLQEVIAEFEENQGRSDRHDHAIDALGSLMGRVEPSSSQSTVKWPDISALFQSNRAKSAQAGTVVQKPLAEIEAECRHKRNLRSYGIDPDAAPWGKKVQETVVAEQQARCEEAQDKAFAELHKSFCELHEAFSKLRARVDS